LPEQLDRPIVDGMSPTAIAELEEAENGAA
jgi:hypothetical protein